MSNTITASRGGEAENTSPAAEVIAAVITQEMLLYSLNSEILHAAGWMEEALFHDQSFLRLKL